MFLGGLSVPGQGVSAAAAGGFLSFDYANSGWDPRIHAGFAHVEDQFTATSDFVVFAQDTRWWDHYGLGVGGGLGYASFSAKRSGGWTDTSGQAIVYVSPAMLRFGDQPAIEVGINSGITRFFTRDVRPFGYFYVAVVL